MEEAGLLSIMVLGFILGVKHAIEPDHLIAVSTIASQCKKLWKSSLAGVYWGIGHTTTLFLVGITIILMKGEIPEKWAMSLEFLVGIMLVYFGVMAFKSFKNIQAQTHSVKDVSYTKTLFIGLVHGLAGSAAMVLLTMSTVSSIWEGAIYIFVFGIGTVVGMLFFTTVIGIPFVLSYKRIAINKLLTQTAGAISTVFGFYYMYNLGITEGLFKLWFQ